MKTVATSLQTHMTPNPVTIDPVASLDEALERLENYGFRHLPVVSCNRVVGILSDRDLRLATSLLPARRRLRDAAGNPIAGPETVSEIMTRPVHCLSVDESPMRAARDMLERRIGAIPIVENGTLVGIVTETNFLQAYLELCKLNRGACDDLVRYQMHRPLPTVAPDTGVEEALEVLDAKVAHLGVSQGGRLLGILSQRDLLLGISRETIDDAKAQAEGRMEHTALPVARIMTPEVLTVEPGATLSHCARMMTAFRVSALPVVEDGSPVGIVTQRDVLAYYVSCMSDA